jgi:hypothetical protein
MTTILIKKKDTAGAPVAGDLTNAAGGAEIAVNTATKRIYSKDSGGNVIEMGTYPSSMAVQGALSATGATTLNGNVTLGDAAADNVTVNGTITSNLIFTDNTYDIGASGATRPRNLYLADTAVVGNAFVSAQSGTTASNSIANASFYNGKNALTFYPQLLNGGYNSVVQVNDYGVMLADTSGSGYNYGLTIGKHNGGAIRIGSAAENMQFGINSAVVAQLSTRALGIGRAPNTAWGTNWNAVELGGTSGGVFASVNGAALITNAYNDNTNWRRIGAGGSFYIGLGQNTMTWYGASATAGGSGADSIISYTQRFTMDTSGYSTFASIAAFNGATPDTSYGVTANTGFKSIGDGSGLRLLNTANNGGGTIVANNGAAGGISIGGDSGPTYIQGNGINRFSVNNTSVNTLGATLGVFYDYGAASVGNVASFADNVNTVSVFMRLTGGGYNGLVQAGDSAIFQAQTTPDYGLVVGKHNGASIRFSPTNLTFGASSNTVGRWSTTGLVVNGSNSPTVSLLQVGNCNYNANTAVAVIGTSNANQPALVLTNWYGSAATYSPYLGFDHSGVSGWSIGPSNSGGSFRIVNGGITSDAGMLIASDGKTYISNFSNFSDPFGVGALVVRSGGHTAYFGNTASSGYTNLVIRREGASSGDQIYFYTTSGGSAVLAGIVGSSGSSTVYGTSSDYRLKKNARPVENAMSRIMAIEPCSFDWIQDNSYGESFIAHKLAEKFPLAVLGVKDELDHEGNPKYQSIDPAKLVPALVAAFQELKNEFDAYKAAHA